MKIIYEMIEMKEILDSEVLSDEDLEKVSGGGSNQTAGDSDFLN